MNNYFFDTSALVKYYISEGGSKWVKGLVDTCLADGTTPANTIFVADVTIAESAAAFAVLHRIGRISKRARNALITSRRRKNGQEKEYLPQ